MAITFYSKGAGVGTETSGAALSPLCPPVVSANHILIAVVFWEGTTTTPSTPAGWTLLDGPRVVETTIGRMWIFGKIADGTEDGTAIAFGSPAVTTRRVARVFSFAGYAGGTISEIVNAFAFLSSATEPQMPTVTTTEAGNLAVVIVGQDAGSAKDSPTGESGGNWVEATAEYIETGLASDMTIAIATATPTANPGTISGGTISTPDDPSGAIAFQIRASAPASASPAKGSVDLTGFAPTVTVSTTEFVRPQTGSVLVAGFAPTVRIRPHGIFDEDDSVIKRIYVGTSRVVRIG